MAVVNILVKHSHVLPRLDCTNLYKKCNDDDAIRLSHGVFQAWVEAGVPVEKVQLKEEEEMCIWAGPCLHITRGGLGDVCMDTHAYCVMQE